MNQDLKHVIFLNGPPRSGKDTFAEIAIDAYGDDYRMATVKFAQPLRDAVCGLFGINDEDIEDFKTWLLNPADINNDLTGRDVMIALSEKLIKPMTSRDFFALRAAWTIDDSNAEVVLITDAGFDYEVAACAKSLGFRFPNCQFSLVQLHREGCSFDGDSRHYVGLNESIAPYSLVNTDLPSFKAAVREVMSDILNDGGAFYA